MAATVSVYLALTQDSNRPYFCYVQAILRRIKTVQIQQMQHSIKASLIDNY